MVSLLIIDENPLLRNGIQAVVESEGGIQVVGDTVPCGEAVTTVKRLLPNVVLMSLKWPDRNAVAICREIRERVPTTRVVVLSDERGEGEMLTSILAGASGYVSRNADGPELVRAIRTAYSGGGYFDLEVVGRVIDRLQRVADSSPTMPIPDALSERDVNILKMVGEGYTNWEISQRLNIATATVRNNLTRIRAKLGLDSRYKLIAYAFRHGLIDDLGGHSSLPDAAN